MPRMTTIPSSSALFRIRSRRCMYSGRKLPFGRKAELFQGCSLEYPSGEPPWRLIVNASRPRSEEHTSELQSRSDLVCRLLLEKKKKKNGRMGTSMGHDMLRRDRACHMLY